MKKIVILTVVVIVIAVAAFLLLGQMKEPKPVEKPYFNNTSLVNKSMENTTVIPAKKSILLAIDSVVYPQLQDRIIRWRQDMEDDTGQEVIVEKFAPSLKYYTDSQGSLNKIFDVSKAETVRDYIREKFDSLDGVIFVGNIIPPTYGSAFNVTPILTDFYFEDFEGICFSDRAYNVDQIPNYETSNQVLCNSIPKRLWMGRLTPNSENEVQELKEYLDRNHRYRKGLLFYEDKVLVYTPLFYPCYYVSDSAMCDLLDYKEKITEMENEFSGVLPVEIVPLRKDPEPTRHIVINSSQNDEEFLGRLSKSGFKIVIYNGHGTPQYGQLYLSPDKLESAKPKAFFYDLLSCSMGMFSERNYMAGRAVFSGNGMVAKAATIPSFVDSLYDKYFYMTFFSGGSFADFLKESQEFNSYLTGGLIRSDALVIIGDPTLRLDMDVQRTELQFSEKEIDMGNITCEYDPKKKGECPESCVRSSEIIIKNIGQNSAGVNIWQSADINTELTRFNETIPVDGTNLIKINTINICGSDFHKGKHRAIIQIIGNTPEIVDTIKIEYNVI